MKTAEIRQRFLDYFVENGHALVQSSSLVPVNDPTLLFTNAGMVQFKDLFLGNEKKNYTKAVSSQKCVRAGGKHNDLENVGYTARHHTFFEMLGNFSFGDYFKREAIEFAWRFLTIELNIPKEKLWITVFEEDDEAADIWLKEIGVDESRFSRIGAKDNFWSMGDVGPCGPCSEIFYDHGSDYWGGPPGTPEEDGDRYIEIWNLVFMQYDRGSDGTLTPLPKPSVDTGMGLERIAAVMQHVNNNYQIDLFDNLITQICTVLSTKERTNHSVRVIADHIRSCVFLINDGVLPSNEGRGYVLRRIIRRAIRHGYQLGGQTPFFYQLVKPLMQEMGQAYPELIKNQQQIEQALKKEELRFAETLEQGLKIFEQKTQDLDSDTIPGELVFLLYDTYGFPTDLTADVAREKKLSIDLKGFNQLMNQQQERARASNQFASNERLNLDGQSPTEFVGYDTLNVTAKVLALYKANEKSNQLVAEEEGYVILDTTPCYAEGGGQIGEYQAHLVSEKATVRINDCQRQADGVYIHSVRVLDGVLTMEEEVQVFVDSDVRKSIEANHSATHLLHAALKQVLGHGVQQKGSLVNAERLRFDFSYEGPVSVNHLQQVEALVNDQVFKQLAVIDEQMGIDQAKQKGAEALFGEKYGEQVRVVGMGEFSLELCGGTHVKNTSQIGVFKIVSESGVASGIRRIEALTRQHANDWSNERVYVLNEIASQLKSSPGLTLQKVIQLQSKLRVLEADKKALQLKLAKGESGQEEGVAEQVGDVTLFVAKLDGYDKSMLRDKIDAYKNKHTSGIIVLASNIDDKAAVLAGVNKTISQQYPAGKLIQYITSFVDGRGGGRPDMAEGGIPDVSMINECLSHVKTWVSEQNN